MTFGNFWFYRAQLIAAGMDPNLIEDAKLLKFDFDIPRWMVTSYELTEEEVDGSLRSSQTRPYTWSSHRYFTEYPNANEAAFLLKLGVDGEQKCFRALEDLPGAYTVQITMQDNADTVARGLCIPSVGTKILLKILSPGVAFAVDIDDELLEFAEHVEKANMARPEGVFASADFYEDFPPVFGTYAVWKFCRRLGSFVYQVILN
ncbi:hypothetical protein IQ07DRAFT_648690 [Pyrenochaeta sp. DS3sAY3a]|nr:hypothetical protein IQ07DRAFT_648690 [Pyrenochaeta sp. DS3sAY3a]